MPRAFEKFFFGLRRREGQTMINYVADHREALAEVEKHGIRIADKVAGWLLPRRAELITEQKQMVQGRASEFTQTSVMEAIYFLFGQDYKGRAGDNRSWKSGKGYGFKMVPQPGLHGGGCLRDGWWRMAWRSPWRCLQLGTMGWRSLCMRWKRTTRMGTTPTSLRSTTLATSTTLKLSNNMRRSMRRTWMPADRWRTWKPAVAFTLSLPWLTTHRCRALQPARARDHPSPRAKWQPKGGRIQARGHAASKCLRCGKTDHWAHRQAHHHRSACDPRQASLLWLHYQMGFQWTTICWWPHQTKRCPTASRQATFPLGQAEERHVVSSCKEEKPAREKAHSRDVCCEAPPGRAMMAMFAMCLNACSAAMKTSEPHHTTNYHYIDLNLDMTVLLFTAILAFIMGNFLMHGIKTMS